MLLEDWMREQKARWELHNGDGKWTTATAAAATDATNATTTIAVVHCW